MQKEIKKNFKGKTLKFYGHLEGEGARQKVVGHIYCPWCSARKDVERSTLNSAAKRAFDLIQDHWKVEHKE